MHQRLKSNSLFNKVLAVTDRNRSGIAIDTLDPSKN
jgi:hypothetical protein